MIGILSCLLLCTGVSAGPAAQFQGRQSLESHPNSQPNDTPSFHPQHHSQPSGSQGFGTRPRSLLHGRPNYSARVAPQLSTRQSTGVRPNFHPVAVPRRGVVSSPHVVSWLGHQAACEAGSAHPSIDSLHAYLEPPRQHSLLTPPGPVPDARLRAETPQGPAPSPQLPPDPILFFNKGPRIKTTIRTSAAGPAAKPVVHVIGSRRAVPLPHSPRANSLSPRASLLYPEAASQLTQVSCSCLSPDATISDTSGSPAPSVDFEVLSRALGAVSTPVHSPSPVAIDQLGITAHAAQSSAAQLDCSESLEKQSPTPSSPTQALTASAPDSAADSALDTASEALPISGLFQEAQLPRPSIAADKRLQTLPGTPAHPTPEALQPALIHAQTQRRPIEGLVASAAEALLSGSQAVKQQQNSRTPEPVALEARKELVSSRLMQSATSDDGIACQQADHQGPDPGPSLMSASILTEASPEAAGEGDEEWVPDDEAMLAASALAGMADSHFAEGELLNNIAVLGSLDCLLEDACCEKQIHIV